MNWDHNLHHPSVTGVSMSHEWALIRDEVICVWGRYCSQRHTKTWARPEGFVGDEISRWPVLHKLLPFGSRKKNEMHFWHLPISERILCWKTEEQQSADWLLPLSYLSSCPSQRGKPRVLVHLCHISVYTCVSYSFFSRLQGLLIAFKSRIHQDSAEELCKVLSFMKNL